MRQSSLESLEFRRKFVLFLLLGITLLFVVMIRGFLEALVLAVVFGALIRPVYLWVLPRVGQRASLASAITGLLAVLVIILPGIFFLGLLSSQAEQVVELLSPWFDRQAQAANGGGLELPGWVPFQEYLDPYRSEITAKLAEFASAIGSWLVNNLSAAAQGTASFFLSLFVMLYALFFYLISGPATIRRAMDYLPLPDSDRDELIEVGRSVSMATLKGTLIIGIIQGLLGGLSLAVAGIPGAAVWGALMAVMSVIPGIGPSIIWAPVVIYLAVKGDYVTALILFAWNAGVVGTIDNILRPRLVGKDAKMPDLLILVSTLGGLKLFGASGLVIGPVIAALCTTVWTIYGRVFGVVPEARLEKDSQAG